jgi:hypothetical protein
MKKLFLTLFILSVITNAVAFAEKAMPPVLLTPTDISKGVSKDSIKFTWQAPQNETNAKVNSYRIVISENIRFNGYSPNTSKCNVTCVVGVVNTPSYSTSLRSSNKTYYWHVQAISSNENGEWSTTNYFKTDIGVPTVTTASASPSSTLLGSNVKFSATLSGSLPSNHSVKLSYGTSIVDMTGAGTNYSVSQTPSQLGQQVFTVGIYDGSNTLKGTAFKGNFEIVKGNSAPTLSLILGDASATVGTNYSVQLQASDVDSNLKSITVDWGDGKNETQNATNATTLTFTHTYTTANTYTWSATATDSSNATSIAVSKSVSVTAPSVTPPSSGTSKLNDTGITTCSNETQKNLPCPVSDFPNQDAQSGRDVTNDDDSDGHAGFSFTKINNKGASLPASATNWNCVKDNVTGLMWEVKTTDGGLHDLHHTYTWYEPDNTKNGGDAGTRNGGACSGSQCDTNAYVKAVNSVGYCGYKDWRMPTSQELTSIVDISRVQPAIDINYFQDTIADYWSSSLYAYGSRGAWRVNFSFGDSSGTYKDISSSVRLVR